MFFIKYFFVSQVFFLTTAPNPMEFFLQKLWYLRGFCYHDEKMPLVVSNHEELRKSLGNSSPTRLLGMLGQPTGGVMLSCLSHFGIHSFGLDSEHYSLAQFFGKPEESTQQPSN